MSTATATDKAIVAPKLGYGISDADQHFYEAPDSITKYLDPKYKDAFRWIDVDGRRQLMLNDRLYKLIPDPTYSKVGAPGSMEQFYRGNNPEGKSLGQIVGKPINHDPAFTYREPRMKILDEQGVDFCIMLPTQALGLEEMLWETPDAMGACVRALNKWTQEEWSWNIDNRVLVTGVVSLITPEIAEKELDILIKEGCKVVGMRPSPVKGPGYQRSPADPVYDRFWAKFEEAGLVLGMHSADTPYSKYLEAWGESGRWIGHKPSLLGEVMGIYTERPIYDTMAAFVCHGLYDRFPKLRVGVLELGAGWVIELIRRMKTAYAKMPQMFARDPVESFIEHTWVMPFYEDDLTELVKHFPVEKLVYGSDWPHPEGFADPEDYIADLGQFTPEQQKMIMRDNLRTLAFGK